MRSYRRDHCRTERERLQTDQADLQQQASDIEHQYAKHGQMPRAFSLATTQRVQS